MDGEELQNPFISADEKGEKCLICNQKLIKKNSSSFTENGWATFTELAEKWSKISLPRNHVCYEFTQVHRRICGKKCFGSRHRTGNCRPLFGNKQNREKLEKEFSSQETTGTTTTTTTTTANTTTTTVIATTTPVSNDISKPVETSVLTRSSTGNTKQFQKVCFVCDKVRPCDSNVYNEGGLGVCEFSTAESRLLEAANIIDESHNLFPAKKRLLILISGESKDVFSAEIRYHRSCYSKFTRRKKVDDAHEEETKRYKDSLNDFLRKVELSIVYKQNAYLLHELLIDWKGFCAEREIISHTINHTWQLKKTINDAFSDTIGFFKNGKYVIVYAQHTNPCEYSVNTLKGFGLRDDDIIRSFANLVKRSIPARSTDDPKFPYNSSELKNIINSGPLCVLYNAIYLTLHDTMSKNEYGYAGTDSKSLGNKIVSLAYDWEALLLREPMFRSAKQVINGMVVWRKTQDRKVIQYLNKQNFSISQNDIKRQNKKWEKDVLEGKSGTTSLSKGKSTHSSIDNIDEETESISLHFTNSNLFQPSPATSTDDFGDPQMSKSIEQSHPGSHNEIPPYSIGKLNGPPSFYDYVDDESKNLLELRFSTDLIWSIIGGLPTTEEDEGEQLPLVGSWTNFNKQISKVNFHKAFVKYMPVIPESVNDLAVLKSYLQFLMETTENLDIQRIFSHCDEAVYSKLLQVIWNNGEKFKKVIPIMGGFHQLLCLQKIMYKRYACIGLDKWIIGAGTTKSASAAEKAVQGRHYNTATRIYKEIFDAIVQMRSEDVTGNYALMDGELKVKLTNLRKTVTAENLNKVIHDESFLELKKNIVSGESTQCKMTVLLLKDISLLLSFIAAAREANIDLHLQCEREFLKLAHGFDHVNYARWGTYQHMYLSTMKKNNSPVYKELKEAGFTASQSGGVFNAVPGDYICERQNAEAKHSGSRSKAGFMKNTAGFNTWIRTRHIAIEMQTFLETTLGMKVKPSAHRDTTPSGIRRHCENVLKLKNVVRNDYKYDFFGDGPVKAITSGKEAPVEVVNQMMSSAETGNQCLKSFMKDRLVTQDISFFHKITKNKLDTGIKKPPKTPKPVEAMKADVQGFGVLAEKNIPLSEGFKSPITEYPMSIAESKIDLRGATNASKSRFRNHLLTKADANTYDHPKKAVWIYDVGKFVRSQGPEATYESYFIKLLKRMEPPENSEALSVHFCIDIYKENSTKAGARRSRGENESIQLHVTGFGQAMPDTIEEWNSALSNSTTKKSMYALLVKYLMSGKAPLKYPTVVNDEDSTFTIDIHGNVTRLFVCDHEEADTRMIHHASRQGKGNVVLVANDSDVLFLSAYACALDKSRNWFYNYEGRTYADLRKFIEFYGDFCLYLPMFHSMTGSDSTSYYHFRGKIVPWNRAVKSPGSLSLIADLGNEIFPSEKTITDCMEFVRTFVYSGLPNENLIETKVRLYNAQTTKKTSSLPPDPNSLRHDILRKHYQAFIWRRCTEATITPLDVEKYGWRVTDGCVTPVWYTCPQLPKCLRKYDKSGYDADNEDQFLQPPNIEVVEPVVLIIAPSNRPTDPNEPPSKKVRRERRTGLPRRENEDAYSADDECASVQQNSDSSESDWELSDSSVVDSSDNSDPDWEY